MTKIKKQSFKNKKAKKNNTEADDLREEVKESLWSRNIRVKDVSVIPHARYDLLVALKYRVKIFGLPKDTYGIQTIDSNDFDVLCVVYKSFLGVSIFYLRDKAYLKELEINGNLVINEEDIQKYFTKKTKDVFPLAKSDEDEE